MSATRTDILNALKNYRCLQTVDEEGEGLPLVDVLTPGVEVSIHSGQLELKLLAEHIELELFYRNRG